MPISRRKPETNVQLVKRLMEFSKYGALSQMFIIDAITKHAEAVAKSKVSDYSRDSLVVPESWIGVATEIRDEFDERTAAYRSNPIRR